MLAWRSGRFSRGCVMDVFLVPVGAGEYELYCEVPAFSHAPPSGGHRVPWWKRRVNRLRSVLVEAEEAHDQRQRGERDDSRGLGRAILRKIIEAVAEQRLLWHLRTEATCRLIHPDDVTPQRALQVMRDT